MLTGMLADAATVGKLLRRVGGGGAGARDGGRPKGRPTLVVRQTSFSGYFPEGSLSRRERVGVRGSCNLPLIFPSSCPSPGGRRDSSFCFAYWNMRKNLFDGVLGWTRQAVEVGLRVRWEASAPGAPQHFSQALHHPGLGGVLVAALAAQARVVQTAARGLIDGELLLNGDVHPHVQGRIGLAQLRQPVAVFAGFGTGEQGGVFGMTQRGGHDELFGALQRLTGAVFAPGAVVNLAQRAPVPAAAHGAGGRA